MRYFMAKQGRPGIPYEQFVQAWEQLINEGRAGTNAVHDILGGSKSTIATYRERYEREKASKELSIIKSIKLTEAVHRAIAEIKVTEIDALDKSNTQLKLRIDEHIAAMKEAESKLDSAKVDFADAKANFDIEMLKLERALAAAQARIEDTEQREKKLIIKCEQLNEQYSKAKQEAAVAKKEIEMLREHGKKK
jgi:chromosome segregation ATPase